MDYLKTRNILSNSRRSDTSSAVACCRHTLLHHAIPPFHEGTRAKIKTHTLLVMSIHLGIVHYVQIIFDGIPQVGKSLKEGWLAVHLRDFRDWNSDSGASHNNDRLTQLAPAAILIIVK
jgi:hypothetical protein